MKKLKKIRVFNFTLLETFLALSILTIVIFFLFSELRKQILIKHKIALLKEVEFPSIRLQEKLSRLFSKIELSKELAPDHERGWFFTEPKERPSSSPSLVFYVHLGIDPDTQFRNLSMCRLSLNTSSEYVLEIIPLSADKQDLLYANARTETLYRDVKKLSLEFYKIQDQKQKSSSSSHLLKMNTWDLSEKELPSFMKITLIPHNQKEPLQWTFQVKSELQPINYEGT